MKTIDIFYDLGRATHMGIASTFLRDLFGVSSFDR